MTIASIFSGHAARLRQFMTQSLTVPLPERSGNDEAYNTLALEWFSVQFEHNTAYQRWCRSAGVTPEGVKHWKSIPAMPTSAFKELDVTSLAVTDRTAVFHSSGTTEQRPSRHFHSGESLALYEASLVAWFRASLLAGEIGRIRLLSLTPSPACAPNSSLVHMFETLRHAVGDEGSRFLGRIDLSNAWALDVGEIEAAIRHEKAPVMLLGTAFSYVNWLDEMIAAGRTLRLPPGSRVLETGGYKGRSRTLPKSELHRLLGERLGVSREQIVCEYGMSELSSQAYEVPVAGGGDPCSRSFHFPPWARAVVVSPETGGEVREGETGLIRLFDLANLWSVSAVQTEDLAILRGSGFELVGRAAMAESRGCSLMSVSL